MHQVLGVPSTEDLGVSPSFRRAGAARRAALAAHLADARSNQIANWCGNSRSVSRFTTA